MIIITYYMYWYISIASGIVICRLPASLTTSYILDKYSAYQEICLMSSRFVHDVAVRKRIQATLSSIEKIL